MVITSVNQECHRNIVSQQISANVLQTFESYPHCTTPLEKVIQSQYYNRELKKASRIFFHLSKDIRRQQTHIKIPSSWLLKCLIHSHFCIQPNNDWRTIVSWTLCHIIQCATKHNHMETSFVELDGITPLFPNSENFSLEDTKVFATALLVFLKNQSSNEQ
ncbi:hypothetical protein [Agarilytica rhodophyticola]|uniref:hypothetical protein n=1 Tax=Agarilytica rhodophyticola TaxID=1737490 RepID=UPI000B3460ED|nr:hypothetical protein [Agarilytica rhodophyticola]